jgi:hypothetical protein
MSVLQQRINRTPETLDYAEFWGGNPAFLQWTASSASAVLRERRRAARQVKRNARKEIRSLLREIRKADRKTEREARRTAKKAA